MSSTPHNSKIYKYIYIKNQPINKGIHKTLRVDPWLVAAFASKVVDFLNCWKTKFLGTRMPFDLP